MRKKRPAKPARDDSGDGDAEKAPDDSAPDLIKRGAEKDRHDARIRQPRRR